MLKAQAIQKERMKTRTKKTKFNSHAVNVTVRNGVFRQEALKRFITTNIYQNTATKLKQLILYLK